MRPMNIQIDYDGEQWWTWRVDNDAHYTRWYEILAQGGEKTEEKAVAKAREWVARQRAIDEKKKSYVMKA